MKNVLPAAKETNRISANAVPKSILEKLMKQKLDENLKKGGDIKEFTWENFLNSKLKMKDDFSAGKYLTKYLDHCKSAGEDIEKICYELFLDFSEGRSDSKLPQPIKSDYLAELVTARLQGIRDYQKILVLIKFYENNHNLIPIDNFYMTLSELFYRGEGVEKNLQQAIRYLKSAINVTNTPNRRISLREMYQEENSELPIDERTAKAYEKVIADEIKFAKTDYAMYLKAHDKRIEAMRWFVADGKFTDAYEVVNLKIKEEIDTAVEEFKKGGADTSFSKSLKSMQENFNVVQDIFFFKEEPVSYSKMALLYTFLGPAYASYRLVKLNLIYFVLALLSSIALLWIATMHWYGSLEGVLLIVGAVLTISLLIFDAKLRKRFIAARTLWQKLDPHPMLKEQSDVFSKEIVFKSTFGWTLIIPLSLWIMYLIVGADKIHTSIYANSHTYQSTSPNSNKPESTQSTAPAAQSNPNPSEDVKDNKIDTPNDNQKTETLEKDSTTNEQPKPEPKPLENHWIKDANGIYVYNPKPIEGESVAWTGGYIQDGDYKYAEGWGTVTWSNKNGKTSQIDEGFLKHGKRHGKFKQKFLPEGNTKETYWDNGVKIDEPKNDSKNDSPALNHKEVFEPLILLHENITKKDYRAAYDYFSDERKKNLSYEGWAKGFKTTLTSRVSDIKIIEESPNKVTLKYNLEAVDNPGGTRNFEGISVVIKTNNGWKIDSMTHKLKK